jgi:hypothetical protein
MSLSATLGDLFARGGSSGGNGSGNGKQREERGGV